MCISAYHTAARNLELLSSLAKIYPLTHHCSSTKVYIPQQTKDMHMTLIGCSAIFEVSYSQLQLTSQPRTKFLGIASKIQPMKYILKMWSGSSLHHSSCSHTLVVCFKKQYRSNESYKVDGWFSVGLDLLNTFFPSGSLHRVCICKDKFVLTHCTQL